MDGSGNILRDSLVKIGLQAEASGLPFLLVGGNALIHYGVPRFTRDIDFLVPEGSVDGWRALLEQSGLVCFHRTAAFLQFDGKDIGCAPVDLMVVDTDTWEKLLAAARRQELADGMVLWLPSPIHLIAMKLQAYRNPKRAAREQDWSDVLHLVREFVADFRAGDFQQLVLRHGGESAWARMQRELASATS